MVVFVHGLREMFVGLVAVTVFLVDKYAVEFSEDEVCGAFCESYILATLLTAMALSLISIVALRLFAAKQLNWLYETYGFHEVPSQISEQIVMSFKVGFSGQKPFYSCFKAFQLFKRWLKTIFPKFHAV